ncbi:VOC family protein [Geomicrobium sp. JCM 19038]|uniref:VOC family protein n=1 Tax=Geomicrobium sp. JCM 19038 TaxID=1460635 RepID=UPI00045F369D|nr:VOC family protein [Geomicrobium sp. JCM 19038]GAK07614.1 PhnB protein [Geomicrobium sp. JCM 19038]
MKKATPFLMFQGGVAERAMNQYVDCFDDAEIQTITRYGSDQPAREGTVMQATFRIKDQEFMCIDSDISHGFDFTPSFSIYITCESLEEFDQLYNKLSEDGFTMMPPDNYGFSTRFAWLNDRFGVSWQLNVT